MTITAVLALAALAACGGTGSPGEVAPSGGSTEAPSGTATSPTASESSASGDSSLAACDLGALPPGHTARCLTTAQAEPIGDRLTLAYEIRKPQPDGASLGPDLTTLDDDGSMLASLQPPDADDPYSEATSTGGYPEVGVVNAAGFEPLTRAIVQDDVGSGVVDFARDGETFVWAESSNHHAGWTPWTVYSWDGATTHEVLSCKPGPEYDTWVIDGPALALANGRVYVTSDCPDLGFGKDAPSALFSRDLAGEGDLVREVEDPAGFAVNEAGELYYGVRSGSQLALMRRDATGVDETVHTVTLADGETAGLEAVSGDTVVWQVLGSQPQDEPVSDWNPSAAALYVLTERDLTRIELQSTGAYYPSLDGSLLAWGMGSGFGDPGEYLADLETGSIWQIGATKGYSQASVSGGAVAWTEPGDGTTVVLKVGRLDSRLAG